MLKKVILVLFLVSITLYSKPKPSGFGLGVIGGEPSGLSAKTWISSNMAFDAAAAWSFKHDVVYIHIDYLIHHFSIVNVKKGLFGIYYGLGGKVTVSDNPTIGVRIPIGIDYFFEGTPLEVFLEIVPGLNLVPDTDFDLNAGIGIRYFF